jgi:hypothetical protein
LTNRDLALNALRDSAVAQDEHHAMRNAYAMGTVPGGIPAHVPDEAAAPVPPPQPEPVHAEPAPEHVPEHVVDPRDVPLPDDEPIMNNNPAYEPPAAPAAPAIDDGPAGRGIVRRREDADAEDGYDPEIAHVNGLHERCNAGTLYRKEALRGEIRILAHRYGLPLQVSEENPRIRTVHQLVHDIRMHVRRKRQAGAGQAGSA